MDDLLIHIKRNAFDSAFASLDQVEQHSSADALKAALKAAITSSGYLTDASQRTVHDVANLVYPPIAAQILPAKEERKPGGPETIKIKSVTASATINPPIAVAAGPARSFDLHAPDITITATVDLDVGAAAGAGWMIGLTQTGSPNRVFCFDCTDAKKSPLLLRAMAWADKPYNDRNEDTEPPWYSWLSRAALDAGSRTINVSLMDRPGEEFTTESTELTLVKRAGQDHFVTCLILYNTLTKATVGLRAWYWHVDWGASEGIVTALAESTGPGGIVLEKMPEESVLEGGRLRIRMREHRHYEARPGEQQAASPAAAASEKVP